jgi:uncharacterized protein DUF1194
MKRVWAAAALAIALAMPLGAPAGSERADVALVLAIDVSGSVDDSRFKLQRQGIAAALESDEVAAAVMAVSIKSSRSPRSNGRRNSACWCPGRSFAGGTISARWLASCGPWAGPGCIR